MVKAERQETRIDEDGFSTILPKTCICRGIITCTWYQAIKLDGRWIETNNKISLAKARRLHSRLLKIWNP